MEYNVIYLDLPCSVKGFCLSQNNFVTIVLNSRLTAEQNEKTLKHELLHIQNDDFSLHCADEIETNRHKVVI